MMYFRSQIKVKKIPGVHSGQNGGKTMLTLESFEQASEIVKQVTQETKLVKSSYFSELTGNKVYLKPENMQRTGAYKVRGAYYKISQLSKEESDKGVIACSAGNHAQGVALAATRRGIKSIVCMPDGAPIMKVENTKNLGAEVCLVPGTYDDAHDKAVELQEETGMTFIHPTTTSRSLPVRVRSASKFSTSCPMWTLSSCLWAAADSSPAWPSPSRA